MTNIFPYWKWYSGLALSIYNFGILWVQWSSPGPRTLLYILVHVRSLILTLVSTRTRFRTIFLKSIRISSVPVLRFLKPTRTRLVIVPYFEILSVSHRYLVRTLVRTHDGVRNPYQYSGVWPIPNPHSTHVGYGLVGVGISVSAPCKNATKNSHVLLS